MTKAKRKLSKAFPQAGLIQRPDLMPQVYALRVQGDCMEPLYADGSLLLFERGAKVVPGDCAAFFLRPELVKHNQPQIFVKRLVTAIPSWVKFPYQEAPGSDVKLIVVTEQLKPRVRYSVPVATLLAVHLCRGLVPADCETFTPTAAEYREVMAA